MSNAGRKASKASKAKVKRRNGGLGAASGQGRLGRTLGSMPPCFASDVLALCDDEYDYDADLLEKLVKEHRNSKWPLAAVKKAVSRLKVNCEKEMRTVSAAAAGAKGSAAPRSKNGTFSKASCKQQVLFREGESGMTPDGMLRFKNIAVKQAVPVRTQEEDKESLSNFSANAKSVSLVEMGNFCLDKKGRSFENQKTYIVEVAALALAVLTPLLNAKARLVLERQLLRSLGLPRMMFVNCLGAPSKTKKHCQVMPHIDTLASYGTVIILLENCAPTDQLTIYQETLATVLEEKKRKRSTRSDTTTQLHIAGRAAAFVTNVPHAIVSDSRKKTRYTLNIFF